MPESEERMLERSITEALTGTTVHVQGLVAAFAEQLTAEGAQEVLDKLRARGFKVTRV